MVMELLVSRTRMQAHSEVKASFQNGCARKLQPSVKSGVSAGKPRQINSQLMEAQSHNLGRTDDERGTGG